MNDDRVQAALAVLRARWPNNVVPHIKAYRERTGTSLADAILALAEVEPTEIVQLRQERDRLQAAFDEAHAARKAATLREAAVVLWGAEQRAALEAAQGVLWMAQRYADGGGGHGSEVREYEAAAAAVSAALALRPPLELNGGCDEQAQ